MTEVFQDINIVDKIQRKLNEFDTVSLKDLELIALLNRKDTKFVFPAVKIPALLDNLKEYYKVLKIENWNIFEYESLYFDTKDYTFYINHHNGKLNRYKIRYRRYVETDTSFFEIKFKTNTGRTIKTRIEDIFVTLDEVESNEAKTRIEFIEGNTPYRYNALEQKLLVFYKRITLASIERQERFTLDVGLDFFKFENGASKGWPHIAIAEIKQDVIALESPVFRIFKEFGIRPFRISKYCLGICLTSPELKINRFKPKLRMINKILNGNSRFIRE